MGLTQWVGKGRAEKDVAPLVGRRTQHLITLLREVTTVPEVKSQGQSLVHNSTCYQRPAISNGSSGQALLCDGLNQNGGARS